MEFKNVKWWFNLKMYLIILPKYLHNISESEQIVKIKYEKSILLLYMFLFQYRYTYYVIEYKIH